MTQNKESNTYVQVSNLTDEKRFCLEYALAAYNNHSVSDVIAEGMRTKRDAIIMMAMGVENFLKHNPLDTKPSNASNTVHKSSDKKIGE